MAELSQESTLATALNNACERVGQSFRDLKIVEEILRLNRQGLDDLTAAYLPNGGAPTHDECAELGEVYLGTAIRKHQKDEASQLLDEELFKLGKLVSDNKGERMRAVAVKGTPVEVLGYIGRIGTTTPLRRQSHAVGRLESIRGRFNVSLAPKHKMSWNITSFLVHPINLSTCECQVTFEDI
jgi:hypothetical protein